MSHCWVHLPAVWKCNVPEAACLLSRLVVQQCPCQVAEGPQAAEAMHCWQHYPQKHPGSVAMLAAASL